MFDFNFEEKQRYDFDAEVDFSMSNNFDNFLKLFKAD
jgi:hypothetical protein